MLERLLGRLRYPRLFWILAILTLADWLIPDVIPFVDEVGLTLLTLLVGAWKGRKDAPTRPGTSASR